MDRNTELGLSGSDLKAFLKAHNLTIKAVCEAGQITPKKLKEKWAVAEETQRIAFASSEAELARIYIDAWVCLAKARGQK